MKPSFLCLLVGMFCFQYSFSQSVETIIGTTTYDLQTQGSVAPRIVKNGSALSAVWTYSNELATYNDRGTGYNYFNGSTWGPIPGGRIENVRTGWPSLLNTIGQEFVISHDGTSGLKIAKRTTIGSGAWILTDMPNPTGRDLLWPRAVSGGANGQSIHVICLTEPLSLGGTLYNGINGALLYYRSTDAGASWDIQAIQIPGTESSSNTFLDQDGYSIFTRGNEIIIGVFNALHDTYVLRSSDNGSTWTKTIIVDFPSETYQTDNWPDNDFDGFPDQVFNSDGSGHVFIDTNGEGHAVFGAMYYTDNVVGDNSYQFYPTTDGLMHWRDDFGANTYNQIASTPDLNGNGGVDVVVGQLPSYGVSMCSHPTMAEGIGGNLFITFTAPSEIHFSSGNQVYRHVFLTTSSNGVDWSYPEDLTPNANISGYEYFAPSLYPVADSHLHYVVQRDTEPGLSVNGDLDPAGVSQIVYGKYELGTLGCTNPNACNYDAAASLDNGSCVLPGCMDANACNYDSSAGCDSGLCTYPGCSEPTACNYNPYAPCADESACIYSGCTIAGACNYNPAAGCNDGSCTFPGCTNPVACNYNPYASCDDGSCSLTCVVCLGDMNSDGLRNVTDMLLFLAVFGVECPSN